MAAVNRQGSNGYDPTVLWWALRAGGRWRCTRSGYLSSQRCLRWSLPSACSWVARSLPVSAGAAAVAPSWQTSAAYTPLAERSAVSCAPNAVPSSTTCVAVGDDGGNVASVIVSQNGGATWSDRLLPPGVTTLSTVSCPSAAVCYAGGGSGIFKSTNGGASWTVQDSSFPAQSISCFTIDECTAVGGLGIVRHNGWFHLESSDAAVWTQRSCRAFHARTRSPALQSESSTVSPAIVGTVKTDSRGPHLTNHP